MTARNSCPDCHGKRLDNPGDYLGTETCPTCAGTGKAPTTTAQQLYARMDAQFKGENMTAAHTPKKSRHDLGMEVFAAKDEIDRLTAEIAALREALLVLADHAEETHPHFESERGQRDIAQARAALVLGEEK